MKKSFKLLRLFSLAIIFAYFNFSTVIAADTNKSSNSAVDTAGQGITTVLCHVIDVVQGSTGKSISILVIISLAIGLFIGKVTWGVAIAVAVGMGVLFGANQLVGYLAEGDSSNVCLDVTNNN